MKLLPNVFSRSRNGHNLNGHIITASKAEIAIDADSQAIFVRAHDDNGSFPCHTTPLMSTCRLAFLPNYGFETLCYQLRTRGLALLRNAIYGAK